MSVEELQAKYGGHIVPVQFNAGFVVLSYVVSLIGAGSTLELINRRTGFKGVFNHVLLVAAAITMGGVAIWSMHFVGNRAIYIANGEPELQVSFSAAFTIVSFFVPILVLVVAFVTLGSNNVVDWWRVGLGGTLCGSAVCGMHYLGNASIQNYACSYRPSYVAGSAIIAIAASTVALALFFVFRSTWTNSWWKRVLSALVLAGAVSGMHWCAALGTKYKLLKVTPGSRPQDATVIVVICLAVGACIIVASLAIVTARKMARSRRKAQKITLATAIFDSQGRILVDTNGLVPSTVVTDSFIQETNDQPFTVSHPHFLWMFQASRNWSSLAALVERLKNHLVQAATTTTRTSNASSTGYEQGPLFRGQFCIAAMRLAERLREDINSSGMLWDEILSTGSSGNRNFDSQSRQSEPESATSSNLSAKVRHLPTKVGLQREELVYGSGSLMFLVRRVDSERECERLTMAGYRFAPVEHVCNIIASRMRIQTPGVESKLRQMAEYPELFRDRQARAHISIFAIRARVNGSGFDILVRRDGRNTLPSVVLPLTKFESWQLSMLKKFEGKTLIAVHEELEAAKMSTERETTFIDRMRRGMSSLRGALHDSLFDDAILSTEVVKLPSGTEDVSNPNTMLAFRILVPIHSVVSNHDYEFTPLSLYKMHQLVLMKEAQLSFIHNAHGEFESIMRPSSKRSMTNNTKNQQEPSMLDKFRSRSRQMYRRDEEQAIGAKSAEQRRCSSGSAGTGSTVNLNNSFQSADVSKMAPAYNGIMVSQEITINVEPNPARSNNNNNNRETFTNKPSTHTSEIEMRPTSTMTQPKKMGIQVNTIPMVVGIQPGSGHHETFVDSLFREAIESQYWGGK